MIRRFPEFVQWPGPALQPRDDIRLCFSPNHPFKSEVPALSAGPRVNGHALQVRELRAGDTPDGCHLLYVAAADLDLLHRVRNRPLVTVGDQPDFCKLGGIINFRIISGRVRFDVNVDQAQLVGLKFDSQFLRLASTLIKRQP